MPRRRSSPAEDLIDLIARLPWWVGVVLAGVLYVVLHRVAGLTVPPATPGAMGGLVFRSMLIALATFGQYVLPALCLIAAASSAWRRRQRRQLVEQVNTGSAAHVVDEMTWQEFELLVGEAFRLQGYRVAEMGGGGADGGVDLVLTRDRETHLVQCKQWRAYRVGVDVVRELYGVMAARGAAGGFVVTSGRFTDEATAFAEGRNVRLIDGKKLPGLLRAAREHLPSGQHPATDRAPAAPPAVVQAPSCPACKRPMVRRVAGKGANAGQPFWGCPGYPACRGTRPIG